MRKAIGFSMLCWILLVGYAHAEWFFDGYLGATVTQENEPTLKALGETIDVDVNIDTAFTVGGRYGYYFAGLPWLGVGVDASYWSTEITGRTVSPDLRGTADLTVVPLSALLFLRTGFFPEPEIPRGRLQPYLALGPALTFAILDAEGADDTEIRAGLDSRAGVGWRFNRNVGLFIEYRFFWTHPEWKDRLENIDIAAEVDLSTHHVLTGVSLRW